MARTSELLSNLLKRNDVEHDQLVSIIFTSTKDLRSAFPALAARELGLGDVPCSALSELDGQSGPEHHPGAHPLLFDPAEGEPAPRLPAQRQAPARRPSG